MWFCLETTTLHFHILYTNRKNYFITKRTPLTSRLHLSDIFFNSLSLASTQKTCFSFHLLAKTASFFVVTILSRKSQNDKGKRTRNFFPVYHKLPVAFSSKCPALHRDLRHRKLLKLQNSKFQNLKQ